MVESKDVLFDKTLVVENTKGAWSTVGFDMSDKEIIFDEVPISGKTQISPEFTGTPISGPVKSEEGTESPMNSHAEEGPKEIFLGALTCYPNLRQSEGSIAGQPPQRNGFENANVACSIKEHSTKNPTTYNKAISWPVDIQS